MDSSGSQDSPSSAHDSADSQSAAEEQFSLLADSVLLTAASNLDSSEFEEIWFRFHAALKSYVHHQLSPRLQGRGQASDIMQSALLSFWKKLEQGAVRRTEDVELLWPYLVKIARRKLSKMWKRIYAKKRASGREFAVGDFSASDSLSDVQQFVFAEAQLQLQADLETIMSRLDLETQTVCSMKLAGMTNAEISHELSCTTRKVERKGELLRKVFAAYLAEDEREERE